MKIKAFAKINISLDVTGKRDNGYHTLSTVMQSISLCDEIDITEDVKGITVECDNQSINGCDNLCFKAAELFFEKWGIPGGTKIKIKKGIPIAAGLGGGSSDAAAVLTGLNVLYGNPLDKKELEILALSLGADVPFCISGGTSLCRGIGEIIQPLSPLFDCNIVIVKCGSKSSTGAMYSMLDRAENLRHPDTEKVVSGICSGNKKLIANGSYNCFEQVCGDERMAFVKESMLLDGAIVSGLSGSGPSVFGLFENSADALAAYRSFESDKNEAFLCKPAKQGSEIIYN